MYLSRVEVNANRRKTMEAITSPQIMHAAVMSSFPSIRDSEKERILWRMDKLGPSTYLLVQSQTVPDFSHIVDQMGWPESKQKWDTLDYNPFLSKIDRGQEWRFRLKANPVFSAPNPGGPRGKVVAHVTAEQQMDWMIGKSSKCGFSIAKSGNDSESPALEIKYRETKKFNRAGKTITISMVTYEGVIVVEDADLFIKSIKNGIGRAKAYGCGMMTVTRS